MVLVFFVTAPFTDTEAIARRIKEATDESDKPVVVVVETYSENYRLIDNLPHNCCVEVPVLATRNLLEPIRVGLQRAAVVIGGGVAVVEVVEALDQPAQVADAVSVGVPERTHEDLVEDPIVPPRQR